MPNPGRRPSANVLRHRDFRLLFIGQSASQIGTQAVTVAMALYITRRTGSATDLGVILGAASAPFVILLLFGGVWADRLPRDRVVIASDSIRAALHALLGILILTGHPAVALIAIIEAAFGCAQAFFQPAYVGLIPQTVPESEIHSAQALRGLTENASLVLGPVLATVLVLDIGAGETFLLDALSFAIGAALLIPLDPRSRASTQMTTTARASQQASPGASREVSPGASPETPPTAASQTSSFFAELRAGYQEVRSRTWVWAVIPAYTGVILFALVPFLALAPLAVRDTYGDIALYGVLITLFGVGSVAASLLATVWHPRYPLRIGLALGMIWALLGVLVALGPPRGVLVAGAFTSGAAGALTGIWWETSLARHIPPQALSRVSAWDYMGSLALMPVGYAIVGPLGSAFGVRWVLGLGGVLGMLFAGAALIPKSVRTLPAEPVTPGVVR